MGLEFILVVPKMQRKIQCPLNNPSNQPPTDAKSNMGQTPPEKAFENSRVARITRYPGAELKRSVHAFFDRQFISPWDTRKHGVGTFRGAAELFRTKIRS
jgi:hypothetical protein